ncbi:MAG: hypothetical protein WDZ83_11020 [Rhizobiaceae bacterium]
MKTWVKVLLGVVVVIALAVAGGFYFTSGVTKTGDEFFAAIGSGEKEKAYATLSSAFRANTSEEELAAFLSANGIDKVSDASWNSRSVSGGRGSLAGTLVTMEGDEIPIEVELIKEDGLWKIYAIRNPVGQPGLGYGPKGLPDERHQLALIAKSTATFADAVAAGDMAGFHSHISHLWGQQFDVAKLNETYRPLYQGGSRLQVIKKAAPVYEGPATLNDQGIMEINFHYPVDAARIHFTLKYIYEGTGWKLIGLSVQTKQA